MKKNSPFSPTVAHATIMIVDDHPIVREGLMAILSKHPDLAVTAMVNDGSASSKSARARSISSLSNSSLKGDRVGTNPTD